MGQLSVARTYLIYLEFTQQHGMGYEETFNLLAKMTTICILNVVSLVL